MDHEISGTVLEGLILDYAESMGHPAYLVQIQDAHGLPLDDRKAEVGHIVGIVTKLNKRGVPSQCVVYEITELGRLENGDYHFVLSEAKPNPFPHKHSPGHA